MTDSNGDQKFLHGSDSSAARNHSDELLLVLADIVSLVNNSQPAFTKIGKVALGTLHKDRLADLQTVDVLTHLTYTSANTIKIYTTKSW